MYFPSFLSHLVFPPFLCFSSPRADFVIARESRYRPLLRESFRQLERQASGIFSPVFNGVFALSARDRGERNSGILPKNAFEANVQRYVRRKCSEAGARSAAVKSGRAPFTALIKYYYSRVKNCFALHKTFYFTEHRIYTGGKTLYGPPGGNGRGRRKSNVLHTLISPLLLLITLSLVARARYRSVFVRVSRLKRF